MKILLSDDIMERYQRSTPEGRAITPKETALDFYNRYKGILKDYNLNVYEVDMNLIPNPVDAFTYVPMVDISSSIDIGNLWDLLKHPKIESFPYWRFILPEHDIVTTIVVDSYYHLMND